MRNILRLFIIATLGTTAYAHNLWVKGVNEDIFKTEMIYGDDFPNPEQIAKEREIIFEPIALFSQKGKIALTQKEEFYRYYGNEKLQDGTYIIKAKYKPTSWIKNKDGKWEMNKTRKDSKNVKECGVYSMLGKSILVAGQDDGEFAKKPLGNEFEITPLVKASEIKEGASIKFKITKNGKPLKSLDVYGSIEGFLDENHNHHNHEEVESMAFYAKTDSNGEFVFKALKSGFWYLKSDYKENSGNKDCELIGDKTTLSFEVK